MMCTSACRKGEEISKCPIRQRETGTTQITGLGQLGVQAWEDRGVNLFAPSVPYVNERQGPRQRETGTTRASFLSSKPVKQLIPPKQSVGLVSRVSQ